MNKVLCIVGPTGVGKTELSIELAKKFDGEIISGDSIQVYKELNVGSAKITEEEKSGVPHYLIDELELSDSYNVNNFQQKTRALIKDISNREKLPLIVGGTGLYIKAAIYDYEFPVTESRMEESNYNKLTNEEIYQKLKDIDPISAEKIHINNKKRMIRALQLAEKGIIKSEVVEKQKHEPVYDVYFLGLTMNREHLYERINTRVDQMVKYGLLEEIEGLNAKYRNLFDFRGIQGIGYKEWKEYFEGVKSEAEVIEEIKKHSRQFARRQYTWFNNQMPVHWFDIEEEDYKVKIIEDLEFWLKN